MANPPVWALVADLENSRLASNRPDLADRLERVLRNLRGSDPTRLPVVRGSTPDPEAWLAPLESVRGLDELSGVCTRPGPALGAAFHLSMALWPYQFRFGLAYGSVDVGLKTGQAGAMDGPAFHRAADALARARAEGLPFALAVSHWDPIALASIEDSLRLHRTLIKDWTERQAQMVKHWRSVKTQREIALKVGVTQPTVSEILERAHARELTALEEHLPVHLDWLDSLVPAT